MGLIVAVIICVVAVIAVPNIVMVVGQSSNIQSADQVLPQAPDDGYDCIVVLGASVREDGTPSNILQDRLDVGCSLYEAGVAPKIIVSGDDLSDYSYDEVTNMKAYLVAAGVPSEDVFCDHAGLCTYDSMYRLKNVFQVRSAVVVTQSYHLYRALFDANSLGVRAVGVASNLRTYDNQLWYDTREIGARVSDMKKVLRKETASYLSEPVSLDQSGNVTSW